MQSSMFTDTEPTAVEATGTRFLPRDSIGAVPHLSRNSFPRPMFRLRTAIGAMVVAGVALAAVGCVEPAAESMKVGECGYFVSGEQPADSWSFQRRACDHPEAALVVVRKAAKAKCPDQSYSYRGWKSGKRVHLCTQLNAQVGDCINDPQHRSTSLHQLRKVPCTAPKAYQVNTRVERDEPGICAASKHEQTRSIRHPKPPVSFCLHRVDA